MTSSAPLIQKVAKAVGILAAILIVIAILSSVVHGSWETRLSSVMLVLPLLTFYGAVELCFMKSKKGTIGTTPQNPQWVKRIVNTLVIAAALLIAICVIIPLEIEGILALHRGSLDEVDCRVVDNDLVFGTWFLYQDVKVESLAGQASYFYFFGDREVRVGQLFKLRILPYSSLILQADRLT